MADLAGRIQTLTDQNAATTARITALGTQAGTAPASPTLQTTDPPATLAAPNKLIATQVNKLLDNAVNSFDRPRLPATIKLDNFLGMQYEIVSKQLTSLRDEVGGDQRILFLEMPTSIESADRRLFGVGGEDKLAQSWWRVKKILRRYKMEDSPCWLGDEFSEQFRYASMLRGRPEYAESDLGNIKLVDQSLVRENIPLTEKTPKELLQDTGKNREQFVKDTGKTPEQYLLEVRTPRRFLTDPQTPEQLLDKIVAKLKEIREVYAKLEKLIPGLTAADKPEANQQDLSDIRSSLRKSRAEYHALCEQFLAALMALKPNPPIPYLQATHTVGPSEIGCRDERADYGLNASKLDEAERLLKIDLARNSTTPPEKDRLNALLDRAKEIRKIQSDWLSDFLGFYQLQIYQALGGPKQIQSAFVSDVELDVAQQTSFGSQSGEIRSVDLIPRQSALNVNTSHALVKNSALSFAYQALFGFGLKVDYQRQREQYDQFMQQETFASGFGKGQATFGWTFGPLPGSRVLNSGVRNTYAVLAVPDDATALLLEGYGCSFNRKADPPRMYPGDLDDTKEDYHCGNKLSSLIEVPNRVNSGGFWLTDVDYERVSAGRKISMILRGSYFSPQTTVLVNGRRIPQVLGLGKPMQRMDSGTDDGAEDGVVSGSFEYVNEKQIAVNLTLPANYQDPDPPVITLVAPSRALTINRLFLHVNGKYTSLQDEGILTLPSPPSFSITGWQFYGPDGGKIAAHVKGRNLTDHIDQVQLNGKKCDFTPLNDSLVAVSCDFSAQPEWEILALSNDTKKKQSSFTVPNPLLVSITSYEILDGVQYDKDLHPISVLVRLTGTGFTPLTVLSGGTDPSRIRLSFIKSTELLAVIQNPQGQETISVQDPQFPQLSASIIVLRPPDKEKRKEDPPKETTVTTVATEKKVTKN